MTERFTHALADVQKKELSKVDVPEKKSLEDMPMHAVRSLAKEKGIQTKPSDNKEAIIAMIKTGETIHKPREVKRAPVATAPKKPAIPLLPEEIKPDLDKLVERGLKWSVDEESCSVTFERDIKVTTTLDQSARNILRAARESFGQSRPVEIGRGRERIEW